MFYVFIESLIYIVCCIGILTANGIQLYHERKSSRPSVSGELINIVSHSTDRTTSFSSFSANVQSTGGYRKPKHGLLQKGFHRVLMVSACITFFSHLIAVVDSDSRYVYSYELAYILFDANTVLGLSVFYFSLYCTVKNVIQTHSLTFSSFSLTYLKIVCMLMPFITMFGPLLFMISVRFIHDCFEYTYILFFSVASSMAFCILLQLGASRYMYRIINNMEKDLGVSSLLQSVKPFFQFVAISSGILLLVIGKQVYDGYQLYRSLYEVQHCSTLKHGAFDSPFVWGLITTVIQIIGTKLMWIPVSL